MLCNLQSKMHEQFNETITKNSEGNFVNRSSAKTTPEASYLNWLYGMESFLEEPKKVRIKNKKK